MKKAVLKKFPSFYRKAAGLQLYCKMFKSSYFEEHLLTVASDFLKQLW